MEGRILERAALVARDWLAPCRHPPRGLARSNPIRDFRRQRPFAWNESFSLMFGPHEPDGHVQSR